MAVINSAMCWGASVFVSVNNVLVNLTNTLTFDVTKLITAVKSFMIQAPESAKANRSKPKSCLA